MPYQLCLKSSIFQFIIAQKKTTQAQEGKKKKKQQTSFLREDQCDNAPINLLPPWTMQTQCMVGRTGWIRKRDARKA